MALSRSNTFLQCSRSAFHQATKQLPRILRRPTTTPASLTYFCWARSIHNAMDVSKGVLSVTPQYLQKSMTRPNSTAATSLKIKSIEYKNEVLDITWDDKVTDSFPYVWMRDSCLCEDCYVGQARKFIMQHVDPEIRPKDVTVDDSKKSIIITWPDSHVTEFSFDWLHQRAFNNRNRNVRQKWLPPPKELWGRREIEGNIPTDTLQNIMNDDKALHKFLFTVEKKGIYILTGAPLEVGQLEKIAKRVAFLRTTNYGVTFQVQVKPGANNPAYTSTTLGFHTDLPFYEYIPGIWLTHCIKQYTGDGGDSLVTDGFYVAEKMRRERPDLFKILTDIPIDYYDVGVDMYKYYMLRQGPTIQLDEQGCPKQVTYNNQDRDYYLDLHPDKVKPLYTALKYWDDMMYREENHIEFKLNNGDIIVLDNNRCLHGRRGYSETPGVDMSRHLEGIYLDWDEARSRRRDLHYQLGYDEHPPIHLY